MFQDITIEASYLEENGTSLFILLQGLVCIHRSSQIVHGISNWGTISGVLVSDVGISSRWGWKFTYQDTEI